MSKSLIRFSIFLAVLCGIAYLSTNALLNRLSYIAMEYAIERLQSTDLILSDPSFRKASMLSYKAFMWDDFGITAAMAHGDPSNRTAKYSIEADTLGIEAIDLFKGFFAINLKGLRVSPQYPSKDSSSAAKDIPEALEEGSATVLLKLNMTGFTGVKLQIRKFATEIKRFAVEGKMRIPIEFSAEEIIDLGNKTFSVGLDAEKRGEYYRVVANKEDLQFIGGVLFPANQTLTSGDINIIAENPMRAPKLLRIRSKASDEASKASAQDPRIPEKAYRHVLWSFLLTKAFGEDFAKQVTDAHELTTEAEGMKDPRAAAYHVQDYNNNEIGRRYATLGYAESNILSLVMTNPKVIRQAKA